jgi:hypothetical protein
LNFATFARRHGFKLGTVNRVVHAYWGSDRLPRSVLGRRILRELEGTLKEPPASRRQAAASGD